MKICPRCKKDYQPTSNAQKNCDDCKRELKRERDRKYQKKKKAQVSAGAPTIKKGEDIGMIAGQISEPEVKEQVRVEVKKGNRKAACLAQLLYASDLLDKQINTAIEESSIDTKIILDIRFRLGEVLRGSVDVCQA